MGKAKNNKIKNQNLLIEKVFELIDAEIKNYKNNKNLLNINEGLKKIAELSKNQNVNKKNIEVKLENLYEKIEKKILNNKQKYRIKDLEKVKSKVAELLSIVEFYNNYVEDDDYDLFESLNFTKISIDILKKILALFPEIVNIKDKNGKSIIDKIISRYYELILNEGEIAEILYLTDVINIISSEKNFTFDKEEQIERLKQSKEVIVKLHTSGHFNKEEIILIGNVIENLSDLNKTEDNTDKYIKTENEHNEQASTYTSNKSVKEGIYKELIDEYIISIDDENTKIVDDALSARKLENGNYLLGVHIASVLAYYDYYSPEVQNAIQMVSNKYYKQNSNNLIFPRKFCTDDASLVQDKKRYAETYYFELTPEGEIVNEKIIKTIITNNFKTDHNRIEQVIANGSRNKKLESTVNNLVEITKIINARNGNQIDMDKKSNKSLANCIVENIMTFHNEQIANFFYEKNIPIIYRVQEFEDNVNKSLGKAEYALAGSHEGLKIKHYTHCSSPLRRAVDIIVQRALDIYYHGLCTDEERSAYEAELISHIYTLNHAEQNRCNSKGGKQKVLTKQKNSFAY